LEIAYSKFERQVEFPMSLEDARITTEYQAGMLLVRIQTEGERP
jgi:HSP20 family molecular chaperone IbpA